MKKPIEQYVIEYCAPTLASLKTGNLFSLPSVSQEDLKSFILTWNEKLREKGVKVVILKEKCPTLIYVYRKSRLNEDINKKEVKEFLKIIGYDFNSSIQAIEFLKTRIEKLSSFPHEIGLFLGYPFEDVIGFIENKGQNCKYSGHWKVYCDECEAIRKFQKYNKCKKVYSKLWNQGSSLLKLTVAS